MGTIKSGSPLVGREPRQNFTQQVSQSPHVGGCGHGFSLKLLWSHISRSPAGDPMAPILFGNRDSKVGEKGRPLVVEKNVGRLDVAMHQAVVMRVSDCFREVSDDGDRPTWLILEGTCPDLFLQSSPRHPSGCNKQKASLFTRRENGNNPGMIQLPEDPCFMQK